MFRILLIVLIIQIFCNTHTKSQDVKAKNLNEKCNYKATLLDSILSEIKKGF
jgi:hypothetical protein